MMTVSKVIVLLKNQVQFVSETSKMISSIGKLVLLKLKMMTVIKYCMTNIKTFVLEMKLVYGVVEIIS